MNGIKRIPLVSRQSFTRLNKPISNQRHQCEPDFDPTTVSTLRLKRKHAVCEGRTRENTATTATPSWPLPVCRRSDIKGNVKAKQTLSSVSIYLPESETVGQIGECVVAVMGLLCFCRGSEPYLHYIFWEQTNKWRRIPGEDGGSQCVLGFWRFSCVCVCEYLLYIYIYIHFETNVWEEQNLFMKLPSCVFPSAWNLKCEITTLGHDSFVLWALKALLLFFGGVFRQTHSFHW